MTRRTVPRRPAPSFQSFRRLSAPSSSVRTTCCILVLTVSRALVHGTTQDGNAPLRQPTFRRAGHAGVWRSPHGAGLLTSSQQPRVVNAELTLAAEITGADTTPGSGRTSSWIQALSRPVVRRALSVYDWNRDPMSVSSTRGRGGEAVRVSEWALLYLFSATWRHLQRPRSDELDPFPSLTSRSPRAPPPPRARPHHGGFGTHAFIPHALCKVAPMWRPGTPKTSVSLIVRR